jgi:hypothetical protein
MSEEKAARNVRQAITNLKLLVASGNFPNNHQLLEICSAYGITRDSRQTH